MTDLLYKRDKTPDDIEALLDQNKRLVYYMLTQTNQLDNQDAESAAWEALWDAINLFDIYGKFAFSTYACTLIRNRIYDVLRAQNAHAKHVCALLYLPEDALVVNYVEPDTSDFVKKVDVYFNEYIIGRTDKTRDILMAWRSSGYRSTATNIAAMCSATPSYVVRVQVSFRAFLSGKLKAK